MTRSLRLAPDGMGTSGWHWHIPSRARVLVLSSEQRAGLEQSSSHVSLCFWESRRPRASGSRGFWRAGSGAATGADPPI